MYETSIKRFQEQLGISRPAYYRFVNRRKRLLAEISEARLLNITREQEYRRRVLQWMRENPGKDEIAYLVWRTDQSLVELSTLKIIM